MLDESADTAAMRMAHDDDIADIESLHRKLQGGRDAVDQSARVVGRHQVGDVAHDEDFAGVAVENHFRRDARVTAADEHDVRPLAGCSKTLETAALQRQPGLDEGPIALGQSCRQHHQGIPASRRATTAIDDKVFADTPMAPANVWQRLSTAM